MSKIYSDTMLEEVRKGEENWNKELNNVLTQHPERLSRFSSVSDRPINRIYSPNDVKDLDYKRDLGFPAH